MPTAERIWKALEEVLDPEYPVSVVDLGLIRGVEVEDDRVRVRVTFTSLGCPCTDLIREDIEKRLLQVEGVREVQVEEVFEPWNRSHLTPKALQILRRLGVT